MRKRNMSILIRVSNDEFDLINKKAQIANSNRNDYIINMVIFPKRIIVEPLKQVLRELKQLNKLLDGIPHEYATETEKSAIVESEVIINKIYQEVYLIARKGAV